MKIEWKVPHARTGFLGCIDKLIGPGATKAEKNLQLYVPFIAGFSIVTYAYIAQLGWTTVQLVIAGLLTVDIVGGIITNATSSAKRWFHRAGQGFKQHLSFVAIHFVQLFLFSWFFLDFDRVWIAVIGGYMMLACSLIMQTPLYLQRAVALTLYSISLLIALYWASPPPGLEWFLPFFYLKLLVSHILREEPYRPEQE